MTQTFVNLKSNTMKNTVKRYGFISIFQGFFPKKYSNLNNFNITTLFQAPFLTSKHNFLTIISQFDTLWQFLVHLLMKPHIMTHVD